MVELSKTIDELAKILSRPEQIWDQANQVPHAFKRLNIQLDLGEKKASIQTAAKDF